MMDFSFAPALEQQLADTLLFTIREKNGHRKNNKMADLNATLSQHIGKILDTTVDQTTRGSWISCTKSGPLPTPVLDGISLSAEILINLDGQSKSADICHLPPGPLVEAVVLDDGQPWISISADLIGQTLAISDNALGRPDLRGFAKITGSIRRPDGTVCLSVSRPRKGGMLISLPEGLRQREIISINGGGSLRIGTFSRKIIHETKMPIASTGKNVHNATENLAGLFEKARRCGHVCGSIVFLRWRSPIYKMREGRRVIDTIETIGPHTLDAYRAALADTPSLLLVYEDRIYDNDTQIEQAFADLGSENARDEFCSAFASDLQVRLLPPEEVAARIHRACPRGARRAEDILHTYGPANHALNLRLKGYELS